MKRLLSILLIIAFLPCQIFAQNTERVVNVIPDASKGLQSHISPYLIPENAASEATNVRVNKNFGSLASREVLVSEISMGSGSVNGVYRFYRSDGTQYTVGAISTLLRYDASGTATTLSSGISSPLSDGKRFQFVTYKDIMIAGNGYELSLKWDGVTLTTANTTAARTAGDLMAELGAPFATLITGTDQTAAKWYQYRVAFYNGTTYSYSTARSNPILTGAAVHSIRLTDIPLGPTGTTHRYIYRVTPAENSRADCIAETDYLMVKDLADNSTQAWTDIVAMGAEPNVPTWATVSAAGTTNNVTPPKGYILEINTERLFVSGNTTAGYQSDVYWSDDGNPDYFTPSAIIMVRPDDGDKVTFLKTFLGILTIGKTNTIQKFYTEGSAATDWSLSNPFSFIGCPAPFTASVSPLGIFYLGRSGLYRFTGQSSELISDVVTREINDISPANISECIGIYWNNEYSLAYASEESSSATNNRVLVYDLIRNAYVVDTKNINCFATFGSGTDYGTLYSGTSSTDGYIFANSPTLYVLTKRYKSEIDTGTFSSTVSSGTESDPILSIVTLDNMESYTNNTLARASWTPSETAAGKKVPPDLGSGVDGSKTVSADEVLSGAEYNFTDLTIDAGKTLTFGGGTTVKVLGTVTINGDLGCSGLLNLYAHTVTIGAAGHLIAGITLRCNTLTNNGVITSDACLVGTLSDSANAAMRDDNFAVVANSLANSQSYQNLYSTITFPFTTSIAYIKFRGAGAGSASNGYGDMYINGFGVAYSGSGANAIYDSGTATVSTGWSGVAGITMYTRTHPEDGAWAHAEQYELQAYIGDVTVDFINGALGTIRPTPIAASTSDYVYALDVFSESTITNEAEYSLKVVVPPGADTLNENITKTISDTDLSALTYILVDVYASRSGTQMQLGLGEGALTDFVNIPVTAANTWETVKIDISGIANANIDHCTWVGIKFTNTTVGNVVYLDNIKPAVTTSSWTSPVYDINAAAFKKLYWNENLNTYGNVTWAIRTNSLNLMNGVTSAAATADGGASIVYTTSVAHGLAVNDLVTIAGYAGGNAGYNGNFTVTAVSDSTHFKVTCAFVGNAAGTWALRWTATEYTNPNGSDISAENPERYIQFRTTLTTSDTTTYLYPWLYQTDGYIFRITYSKLGANYETTVSNVWKTGFRNLGNPGVKKMIKRVKVFYEGEAETINVKITGDDPAISQNFNIDMSVLPDDSLEDRVTGSPIHKIFTWTPPVNSESNQSLISEVFQFKIVHNGDDAFRINQLSVLCSDEPIY